MLTNSDWHKRFQQQARWTRDLRRYIYNQVGLQKARRILEVGCGTGILLEELGNLSQAAIHGLDIDRSRLIFSRSRGLRTQLVQGDGMRLPYASGAFDLVICHYLLLWVSDPDQVVAEMTRVARPGGAVCALAEPDYGGRIDFPPEMAHMGELQRLSLQKQGVDIEMGRKLRGIFTGAGLKDVESGVLSAQWSKPPSMDEIELEWAVMKSDVQGEISEPELSRLQNIDLQAWRTGERVLYIPTFYAWGRVQG